jgi:hypothetical protein
MNTKPRGIRYVILNVYGGESLHHPNIIEILSQVREKYQPYTARWHLTVTTTTNAIVSNKKLQEIIPYIDEFTVSHHSESNNKQKQQFKENLLTIKRFGKRQKCVVLMHQNPELFADSQKMIDWLNENDIKFLPKQLDGSANTVGGIRLYDQKQVLWFNTLYKSKTFGESNTISDDSKKSNLTNVGRACCGGRQMCVDKNYKQRDFYVDNKFPDWYCSVNYFFLYVKQVTGEVYVNKDCKMNFDGTTGPIANLSHASDILSKLKTQLDTDTLPVIQCKKYNCLCGLCAPKAKELQTYHSIMEKYQKKAS